MYALNKISYLYTDDVRFCCLVSHIDICSNYFDSSLSSCSELIASPIIKVLVWTTAIVCIFFNGISFAYHLKCLKQKSESAYFINLSLADIACGVYLLAIGTADAFYSKTFILFVLKWQRSIPCRMAMVLSTISYISSALWLDIISLSRCLTIGTVIKSSANGPLSKYVMVLAWTVTVFVAVIPVVGQELYLLKYPYGSLCLTLVPFGDNSNFMKLFSLSISVFVILSIICIISSYIWINTAIKKSHKRIRKMGCISSQHKRQKDINLFIVLITGSSLLTWIPVCVTSVVSVTSYQLSPDVMNAIISISMPLNSLINPCLYTFGTQEFKSKIKKEVPLWR